MVTAFILFYRLREISLYKFNYSRYGMHNIISYNEKIILNEHRMADLCHIIIFVMVILKL